MSQRAARPAAALVLLAALATGGCGGDEGTAAPTPDTSSGATTLAPVLDQDFPDPDVLFVDGTYYAYATQPGDGTVNVQVATSTDLRAGRSRRRTRCRSCPRGPRPAGPGLRR